MHESRKVNIPEVTRFVHILFEPLYIIRITELIVLLDREMTVVMVDSNAAIIRSTCF